MMENRTTIQISESLRKELKILSSQRDIAYQDLLKEMVFIFKELDREKTIVSIPNILAKKIKEKIKHTDIKSISEYIAFILRMILMEEETLTKPNEDKIKKKLRKLGYL
ncbi:MAG: hypothetical protein AB1668_00355 [Nanoarchaeota archaeon]